MPIPPTTMPTQSARARDASSNTTVTARLASATGGAAENKPANTFGLTIPLIRAKTTTNVPPATPRTVRMPTSERLTRRSRPGGRLLGGCLHVLDLLAQALDQVVTNGVAELGEGLGFFLADVVFDVSPKLLQGRVDLGGRAV